MEILNDLKALWYSAPSASKKFLVSGILLLIIWQVLYLSYLLPHRILDEAVTNITTAVTVKVLRSVFEGRTFSYQPVTDGANVYSNQQLIFYMKDGCNALAVFINYAIFILVYPSNLIRKGYFVILGAVSIFIVNVLRCVLLAGLFLNHNKYSEFAHHYVFNTIVYAFVLLLWIIYANKKSNKKNSF
jgi:exosortase family protein XrtF